MGKIIHQSRICNPSVKPKPQMLRICNICGFYKFRPGKTPSSCCTGPDYMQYQHGIE